MALSSLIIHELGDEVWIAGAARSRTSGQALQAFEDKDSSQLQSARRCGLFPEAGPSHS
jgi:hypothetical protein